MRLSKRSRRYLVYGLAFATSILVTGFFVSFIQISSLMIPRPPRELASGPFTAAPILHPDRLKAAVLLSRAGVQVTDLMAPYEILAESGRFDVYTVARDTRPLPTTGGVSLVPDYRFDQAPAADLLVIPAELDPDEADLQAFVRERAPRAREILAVCEGARVLARAGLLDGRNATTHRMSLARMVESFPGVHWLSRPRWVEDRGVITSAGVTASIDASMVALARLSGPDVARRTASTLGFPDSFPALERDARPEIFSGWDFFRWMARAGFDWGRPRLAVLVYPGVSELSLAAMLDTFMRSQSYSVTPLAIDKGRPVRTRHGLLLDAEESLSADSSSSPSGSETLDTLVIPSNGLNRTGNAPREDSLLKKRLGARPPEIVDFEREKPARAFEEAVAFLSERQGAGTALRVARMVEYPKPVPPSRASDYPLRLWIRALLVGFLAVFLVWMARVRLIKS